MTLISLTHQTLALAGIAQVCSLVRQLATTGAADSPAMMASIGSVMKIDSDNVFDVFGGLPGVQHGLEQLDKQLTSRQSSNPDQARYAALLVHLQKQLVQKPEMLNAIRLGVEKAQRQAEHFGVLHQNVLANMADLYHANISTLQPRIMVIGDQQYLADPNTVNKIRALLLAGIRSAHLWRQCGGSRWQLMFHRVKLKHEAQALLAQL